MHTRVPCILCVAGQLNWYAICYGYIGQIPQGVPSALELKPLPMPKMVALDNILHVLRTNCALLTLAHPEILEHYAALSARQRGVIDGTWEPTLPEEGLYRELTKRDDDPNKGVLPIGEFVYSYKW